MGRNSKYERAVLVILTLMLVSVFVISINMYDDIESSVDGSFIENEAVAAFLGIEETKETVTEETHNVSAAAAEYIERYNGKHENDP